MSTSTLNAAREVLLLGMGATTPEGFPIVPAKYAVRCPTCNERIEARLETSSLLGVHHVLPVDNQGRCTSCVLLLCEVCHGQDRGCEDCGFTGMAR